MSAADSRAPRLTEPQPGVLQRLREWLVCWRTPRDPLLVLAIDDEIENHILERTDKLIDEGMSPRAARREAEHRFGNVGHVRRTLERIGGTPGNGSGGAGFGSFIRDLRHGVRLVAKSPGFAAAVIVTIGLGVGANTALFSVTDAVLLRPLPYEDPAELVSVEVFFDPNGVMGWMGPQHAAAWRRSVEDIVDLTAYARMDLVRTGADVAEQVAAHAVSIDWLETLGVGPAMGRPFSADDLEPEPAAAAIVSHGFWSDSLDADPAAIGSTIELNRRRYTVVGIMPEGFKFPALGSNDLWVPMDADGNSAAGPAERVGLVARLPAGAPRARVQQRLDASLAVLEEQGVAFEGATSARLQPLDSFRANDDVERALWVLTGAVGIMLLIAAVNAANLLLLRATARASEDSVRLALGASRARLVRQHLTENMVLVAAGGLLAVLLARLVLGSIVRLLPSEITFFLTSTIVLDTRVLVFALGMTAVTGLMLSLVPALRATRIVQPQLAGVRSSAAPGASLLRNALVVAEVAMTVTLLVGAGLMINSFVRLTSVDPGYRPDGLVQLTLNLPDAPYAEGAERARFARELSEAIGSIPGVERVALANGAPPRGATIFFGMVPQAEGHDPVPYPGDFMNAIRVDESFFRTLQTPVIAGRGFTSFDRPEDNVVIVDRDTARFFWGDESPVGKRLKLDSEDPEEPWITVVGVVENFKLWGLDDRQGSLDFFYPLGDESVRSYFALMARTSVEPAALLPAVRAAVHDLDPELPINELTTAARSLEASIDKPRFFLRMMVIFAGIALGLAVIDTYGVLAFTVRRRRLELGVRIALGADGGRLRAMVVKQGLAMAVLGVLLGAAGALALGGLARALLFEVEPTDPLTFTLVAAVMLACAGTACWVPARRATQVDPVEVLRAE